MNRAVFLIDTISHAFSSLGVARRLEGRGYLVEYWGSPTNVSKPMIQRQGFTYHDVDALWSRYHDEIRLPTNLGIAALCCRPDIVCRKLLARRRWMRKVDDALRRCESSLDRLIAATPPAFVVIDPFLLAYYPLLWARRVKTVVLCTKPLAIRDALVPPYDSYLMPPRTWLGRLAVAACWERRRAQDVLHRATARLCEGLGGYTYHLLLRRASRRSGFPLRRQTVRRWIQPDMRFRSLHEWALWIPEMDLPRRRPIAPDTNVRYIGPCVHGSRWEDSSAHIDRIERSSRKYLIYVAVGTARFRWRDNLAFMRKVIEAFREARDVTVVVSTSDPRATQALGPPPDNVLMADFAPQLAVLDKADLVITHAGAGTLRECIDKEVPLLAYPRNHDQMGNAARIAFHGIGLRGRRRIDTPLDIREKAMRILGDPVFKHNLRRMRALVYASQDQLLTQALEALGQGTVATVPVIVGSATRAHSS